MLFRSQSGVPHKIMHRTGPIRAQDLPDADYVVATWWETAVWMQTFPVSKGAHVHLIQGYEVWGGPETANAVHAALRLPNIKITISHALADTLRQAVGPLALHVVPNAVDLQQFQAPERNRNTVPRVGFIYAHAAIKGSDICIDAVNRAREQLGALDVLEIGRAHV